MMVVSAWWGGMLVGGGALLEQKVGRHTHSLMSSLMRSTHHLTLTHPLTLLRFYLTARPGEGTPETETPEAGQVR